ncbi:unnamed protein product [Fusarium graminearum]|uniref:Uncharacterized protein n=1 Tax=Gibberella zeae TaxID=5518 RepID=A0A9N8RQB0_GIBZA|nr:unnamed protein product [Fusarium graminearum]
MDMFSRLPTLVHTTILGQIQSDRDLFSLIRASPQSLQLYARYRCTVARQRLARFLELDTDGNMIQDALAIINFPRINQSSPIPLAIMSDWFDMLNTRSFNYRHSIDSLYPFFTRLVVFIEDYLAKSLDPFPVRACMTLPTIGRSVPCMQFKGKETDVKPVSFGMFPAHTQRRLLQAFISYELRCKIYDPRVWDPLERNSYASMVDRLNERLTLSDCEELHCVFEYIKSMYGAVKAQSTDDTWFPDRQVPNPTVQSRPRNDEDADLPSARDLGLLYPDNLYFDGALRSIPRELDILSCLGLDLLSSIIQNSRMDYQRPLQLQSQAFNQPVEAPKLATGYAPSSITPAWRLSRIRQTKETGPRVASPTVKDISSTRLDILQRFPWPPAHPTICGTYR